MSTCVDIKMTNELFHMSFLMSYKRNGNVMPKTRHFRLSILPCAVAAQFDSLIIELQIWFPVWHLG